MESHGDDSLSARHASENISPRLGQQYVARRTRTEKALLPQTSALFASLRSVRWRVSGLSPHQWVLRPKPEQLSRAELFKDKVCTNNSCVYDYVCIFLCCPFLLSCFYERLLLRHFLAVISKAPSPTPWDLLKTPPPLLLACPPYQELRLLHFTLAPFLPISPLHICTGCHVSRICSGALRQFVGV